MNDGKKREGEERKEREREREREGQRVRTRLVSPTRNRLGRTCESSSEGEKPLAKGKQVSRLVGSSRQEHRRDLVNREREREREREGEREGERDSARETPSEDREYEAC